MSKQLILVAEDDVSGAATARQALVGLGDVVFAASAAEAERRLRESPPALVVADGDMAGAAAVVAGRGAVPAIVFSGTAGAGALGGEGLEWLAKPLSADALRRCAERRLCLSADADAPLICALLDNAPFAATLWSLGRGLLLYANPALGRMLKIRDRDDWVVNHYAHQPRCQPDGNTSPEAAAERLAEAAAGGCCDFVWTYIDGEGDMVPVWVSLRRARPAPGDLAVGYVLDLRRDTEIKRVIRNERDNLRGIVDASPIPFVRAAGGAIERCNPAAEQTFALRPGLSPAEVFCEPGDFAALAGRLHREGEVSGLVARLRRKDGQERRFLVKAKATTFEERPGMLLWLIDVEDLDL